MKTIIVRLLLFTFIQQSYADCLIKKADESKIKGKLSSIVRDSTGSTDGLPIKVVLFLSNEVNAQNFETILISQFFKQKFRSSDFLNPSYDFSAKLIVAEVPICSIIKFTRVQAINSIEYNGLYFADPSVRVSQ